MRTNANNPYVGLRPFDVDEGILFFGRNDQTLELLQRLHQHHFVAVVGSSGSGKSSLLRAGLIPALKAGYLVEGSDQWFISIMKPGQSPLYNLAAALLQQADPGIAEQAITAFVQKIKEEGADAILNMARPMWKDNNINFFLLIDQFEELFRFAMEQQNIEKKDEAIDFVNIMLELSQQTAVPFYVVITMRSDFIGDCAQFYGLPEAMNQSQYLVPRLTRMQMRTVIEGPAKLYGGKVSPALTSRLLNELGKIKDELPLLQHALMRIWDHETDVDKSGELDLLEYESIGGFENALSIHADEAMTGMNEAGKAITKKLFVALTAIDEHGRKIRRPALLSELKVLTGANESKLLSIINLFIKDKRSFIIINKTGDSDDKVIDISHESLIRQWKTLCQWVDEEGESTANYLHLTESAELYKQHKKDFLTGSELHITLDWYNKFKPVAAWGNRYKDGFTESIDYLKRSEADWKSKKRRQKIMVYAIIVVLAIIAIAAAFTNQRLRNLNRINVAGILAMKAERAEKNDPTLALGLAAASLEKYFDSATYQLESKIYTENSFYKIIADQPSEITALAYAPDGKTILSGSTDSIARLWDLKGNLLKEFKGHSKAIYSVLFSPDGKTICTGSGDSTVRLWNLEGNTIQVLKGHTNSVYTIAFSPGGDKILTGSLDNTARLWDLKGNTLQEFKAHSKAIKSVAFSTDGKMVLTGSSDSTARLWDLNGNVLNIFRGHTEDITAVAFSPDGKTICTGSEDHTARLWDMKGEMLQIFSGHNNPVISVAFSPAGDHMLTGSGDSTACLWDLKGNILKTFRGHSNVINAVSFSPDGKTVCTGSADHTVRSWMLRENNIAEFIAHTESVNAVAFSPDGKTILSGSSDSTARLWNLSQNTSIIIRGHSDVVKSVAFSPDGRNIATCSSDSTARLWDNKGNLLQVFKGHTDVVNVVAFSPDGKTICTGSEDHTARLWSIEGNLLQEFKAHTRGIKSLGFSPDGKTICTGSFDGTTRLWDLKGDTLNTFRDNSGRITSVAFSPDGKTLITGSGDKTARLRDLHGNILQEFKTTASILSVAFSPDGKNILVGSGDYTARLFDLKGNSLSTFKGHTDVVNAVVFSADGKIFCTGSDDKTIRLWALPMPLTDFLKSDQFERLTAEQKKLYGVE